MCGIFGGIPKKGRELDLAKIKLLGIYNIQRGVHSTGYYYAGHIDKGVDALANFGVYVVRRELLKGDLPGGIFMGHNRHATNGTHNAQNAHPHEVEQYVQTHNGVIRNIWKLAEEYTVDSKGTTVDSVALARIIEARGFDVLNHYEGYAALTMAFKRDPETLYLYHGASKELRNGDLITERPLFTLETDEGLYYSSLKESLEFINQRAEVQPVSLPANEVFKCQDGKIIESVYIVNREEANCLMNRKKYEDFNYDLITNTWLPIPIKHLPPPKVNSVIVGGAANPKHNPQQATMGFQIPGPQCDNASIAAILRETNPNERFISDVYYRHGRHLRDSNILLNGKYTINRDGDIVDPAKSSRLTDDYWFIRGIMMNSEADYNKALELYPNVLENLNQNLAYYISRFSRYPITCLGDEATVVDEKHRRLWYKDGKIFKGSITPKFTKRVYVMKEGYLSGVHKAKDSETIFVKVEDFVKHPLLVDNYKPAQDKGLKAKEQEEKNVRLSIYAMVRQWCNKVIKLDDVCTLPEHFLVLMDYVITNIISFETGSTDMSDKEIENQTTLYLRALITLEVSFTEHLSKEHYEELVNVYNIGKCFEIFPLEDLLEFANRYEFIDFDEDLTHVATTLLPKKHCIVKKVEEITADQLIKHVAEFDNTEAKRQFLLLVDQFAEVEKIADACQKLENSDLAQETAFIQYEHLGQIKKEMIKVAQANKAPELAQQLVKITC